MGAIFRREFTSYFKSINGYVFFAAMLFMMGLSFSSSLSGRLNNVSYVFQFTFSWLMFLVPALTARLMSEDKKLKIDQAFLTAPVSLFGVVFGKFLAAFLAFAAVMGVSFIYGLVLSGFTAEFDWVLYFCNFIGILLAGGALIAVCLFASAITENQISSYFIGVVFGVVLMFLSTLTQLLNVDFLTKLGYSLSFSTRYDSFTKGVFNISDILFFLSFIVVFIFLSIRVLEKRRWS